MSTYENYNKVSSNYDSQRAAMGVDVICGMVSFYTKKPLKDLHILDAGCGTGNYTKDMISRGACHFTLLDASEGMLEKAKTKLADFVKDGRVKDITLTVMPPLPYPDGHFDVVMFNLVLHHLEKNPDGENFPAVEATLRETRRVLRKGGVVSISTSFPKEVMHIIWFACLNENIGKRHAKQYIPGAREWEAMFNKTGFRTLSIMQVRNPMTPMVLNALRDGEGPLKKEWRECNSFWASATDEEIKDVENRIKQLKEEGLLENFVDENDKSEGYYALMFLFAEAI